jgi:hypothetical protein
LKKKDGELARAKKLIVVVNSLHYMKDIIQKGHGHDVVIIDEIETLIDKFMGDFMEQKEFQLKSKVWETFCYILKNAKKVIFLDAFITTKTINFINTLEKNDFQIGKIKEEGEVEEKPKCQDKLMTIFERIHEPQTRVVKYLPDYTKTITEIVEKIKGGSKVIVFYPYKKQGSKYPSMEMLFEMMKTMTGKEGICYNADVSDKIKKGLKNVNVSWKDKQFIITNNIITCGVNYENVDVDYKYIFVASHNVPRDIIQFSYRARHLTSGIIKICFIGRMNQANTWLNDCDKMNCPVYRQLYNDILIESKAPLRKSIQLFCHHAKYKTEIEENKVNEKLQLEIQDLFNNQSIGYCYDNIENINDTQSLEIQQAVCGQMATMSEKFSLRKYFFKRDFKDENDEMLSKIWDDGYSTFFSRLEPVLKDENNVFNKIKELNELETVFPINVKKNYTK